jgi:hypothetical protein
MKGINWFVVMILGIWICAAVGALRQKDASNAFGPAAIVTIIAGIGYFLYLVSSK